MKIEFLLLFLLQVVFVSSMVVENSRLKRLSLDNKSESNTPKDRSICQLPQEPGNCSSPQRRWFHDAKLKRCRTFVWTGCGKNANNFRSRGQCEKTCMSHLLGTNPTVKLVSATPKSRKPNHHLRPNQHSTTRSSTNKINPDQNCLKDSSKCPIKCTPETVLRPIIDANGCIKCECITYDKDYRQLKLKYEDEMLLASGTVAPLAVLPDSNLPATSARPELPVNVNVPESGKGSNEDSKLVTKDEKPTNIQNENESSKIFGSGHPLDSNKEVKLEANSDIGIVMESIRNLNGDYFVFSHNENITEKAVIDGGIEVSNGVDSSILTGEFSDPKGMIPTNKKTFEEKDWMVTAEMLDFEATEITVPSTTRPDTTQTRTTSETTLLTTPTTKHSMPTTEKHTTTTEYPTGTVFPPDAEVIQGHSDPIWKVHVDPTLMIPKALPSNEFMADPHNYLCSEKNRHCRKSCVLKNHVINENGCQVCRCDDPDIPNKNFRFLFLDDYVVKSRKQLCSQPAYHGPCSLKLTRWYFDPSTETCTTFEYGGCRGNENNFRSEASCLDYCKAVADEVRTKRQKWYRSVLGMLKK